MSETKQPPTQSATGDEPEGQVVPRQPDSSTGRSPSAAKVEVDPEFETLVPPLSPDELAQLEESLLMEGCRDPLITWGGKLLDGHHRLRICREHSLAYSVDKIELADRDAAVLWVIRNQLGRRNLSLFVRGELALRLEPLIAASAKENQRAGGGSGSSGRQNSDKPTDTKRELAARADVSHDTIARVKYLVENAEEKTLEGLRLGETTINKEYQRLKPKRPRSLGRKKGSVQRNRADDDPQTRLVSSVEELSSAETRFRCVYAIPPWPTDGDAAKVVEKLCGLPVRELIEENAHLHLWCPCQHLFVAKMVFEAWGFEYVDCFVWVKSGKTGTYWDSDHEFLLLGKRGEVPFEVKGTQGWGHFSTPRDGSKPRKVRTTIEEVSPGPYLELFGRGKVSGWTVWPSK